MSGYGQILQILFMVGVKLHIKHMFFFINFLVKSMIENVLLDLRRTLKRTPLTTIIFPNLASELSMQFAISRILGNLYRDCEYTLTMTAISDMQLSGLSPAFTFKLSFLVINKD